MIKIQKGKFTEQNDFRKKTVLFVSGILTPILYLLLSDSYRVLSLFLPLFTISYCFSKRNFSYPIFLLLFLFTLLFPSSIFTMDVGYNPQVVFFTNFIESTVNVLSSIVIIAIPILSIIGVVYAFGIGNIESAVSTLTKLIVFIVIVAVFLMLARICHIPLIGVFDGISDFALTLWQIMIDVTEAAQNLLDWIPGIDFPDMPSIDVDSMFLSTFSTPQKIGLTFISAYPFILGGSCFVIGSLSLVLKAKLPKWDIEDVENKFSRPRQVNYSFLVYGVILLVIYFALFLWLGEEGFMNYRSLGFFTIYISIIIFSTIILAFGFGSISKANLKNSVLGTILGIFTLQLLFNSFTQLDTLHLLSFEFLPDKITIYNIISQVVFVAPAESLLFHICLPAMVMYYILNKKRKYNDLQIDFDIEELESKSSILKLKNEYYQTAILKPKINENLALLKTKDLGDTNDYIKNLDNIARMDKKIRNLKKQKNQEINLDISKFNTQDLTIFSVFLVIFNFIFSSLHYFNSGLDFVVFWASGLGLIYFLSGFVLTFVSFKYGWFSGISVHAFNNITPLLLILLIGGF